MTSIERTAYPRFARSITAVELRNHFLVERDEARWAAQRTDTDEHLLAFVLLLKCLQKMSCFPAVGDIPAVVVGFVRRQLGLVEQTMAVYGSDRIERNHKALIRERVGVVNDQPRARQIAEDAIRAEARRKNNPPDLINVALEKLTEAGLEFPAYSTLDAMTSRIRAQVNDGIIELVYGRMTDEESDTLAGLPRVRALDRRSLFDWLKRPAKSPTWSHFRDQVNHLNWVDRLGDSDAWFDGIAASKITDFAGEAEAADAGVLGDYQRVKRIVLIACLVHRARQRARDDLATMFCKRVALKVKAAKDELEDIRRKQRSLSEGLVTKLGTLLRQLDTDSAMAAHAKNAAELAERCRADLGAQADPASPTPPFAFRKKLSAASAPQVAALLQAVDLQQRALGTIERTIEQLGGTTQLYADIETVSAHYGDLYELLIAKFLLRADRAALYEAAQILAPHSTSDDQRVLAALEHARANRDPARDYIPEADEHGEQIDLGFASDKWQRVLRESARPARLARRHFEACVFVHLAAELRTGDVAVPGAEEYADWNSQLLTWAECEDKLPAYLFEVGLAEDPAGAQAYGAAHFRRQLFEQLRDTAALADAGYPTNDDLRIDPKTGVPHLKRHKRGEQSARAKKLEQAIKGRMPERSLLSIVARTAFWLEWWRRFSPASGSDPKIKDPFGRYVIATFVYGANMGPYEAARHIRGVSAHELFAAGHRHANIPKLNEAIADVVNGHAHLDLVRAWGDGTVAAADGTHIETWLDNLLAETSIQHGKPGGIAYHHISDLYIALFTHFVPCGVWEAVYIIEGLLKNASEVQPTTVHADTQGQSYPIYTLGHLMGFQLMPRVRNWKDLIFYRPTEGTTYRFIDSLFGPVGANTVDWNLIETHFRDLMRVAISIREGRISSTMLMRRLSSNSRRNHIYQAFREVGKVIRTIQLLKYISDGPLRRRVTAATNKVESYNGFAQWLQFGKRGVLADNDPDQQEKLMKFNQLLANCVIFHNTLDMMDAVRTLQAEGWQIEAEDLAQIAPYLTEHINRFGEYSTDELALVPEQFDPHLEIDFETLREPVAG